MGVVWVQGLFRHVAVHPQEISVENDPSVYRHNGYSLRLTIYGRWACVVSRIIDSVLYSLPDRIVLQFILNSKLGILVQIVR